MLNKVVCYTSWLYLVLAGIKVQKKIISADEINYESSILQNEVFKQSLFVDEYSVMEP